MRRRILVGLVTALFLLLLVATSLQGTPTFEHRDFGTIDPPPVPVPSGSAAPQPLPTESSAPDPVVQTALRIVFFLVIAVVVALVLYVVFRVLAAAWRDRALQRRRGGVVDASLDAAAEASPVQAPMIRRGITAAMQNIDERPEPSDAIVAAWVGLEQSAADAGLVRAVNETPSELTLRILTDRDGIEQQTRSLLALYENVRFGGRRASEADRSRARAALAEIEQVWR